MTSTALVSRVSVDANGPNGPVPSLTRRVIELLGVEKKDLVVDLDCRVQSPPAVPEEIRYGARMFVPSLLSEQLSFLLNTSGVRMVQMGWLTFGRLPMRYQRVLVRDGPSQFKGSLRRSLAAVFDQLDPAGRLLIVDSAPGADTPLYAEGLRRWKQERQLPEVIADLMREAGFSARTETVECLRRVSTAECYAWVASRSWPSLGSSCEAELQRGLCELRARYGSQPMVEFTSRFDLVLGTKPVPLAT